MLHTGVPRKRRKAVKGANKVACATCGIPGLSIDMVWRQLDVRGFPYQRALVHPECKDAPNPSVLPRVVRTERPPYTRQAGLGATPKTFTAGITVTTATFATTGTTSATVAQVTADPTVNVTGTGFTSACRGRVKANSTQPLIRTTTVGGATSLSFECETIDIVAGTLNVGVVKLPSSASGFLPAPSTINLTIT